MNIYRKGHISGRVLCAVIAVGLTLATAFHDASRVKTSAAAALDLPEPAQLVAVSPTYDLPFLRGISFDAADPLNIRFMVDQAGREAVSERDAALLIRYFLAALTVSSRDLWVNLSPDEQDRVLADGMETTELGRDLLAQDYLLKQLASSLTHPDTPTGEAYWRVENGKSTIENRLGKIWIVPDKAEVYENGTTVVITEASLKLQCEDKAQQVLLPAVTKDVNEGRTFARLRQIYHSVILAAWFKAKLKDSLYAAYIDRHKLKGIDTCDPALKEKIFGLYVESFKKGVYDTIRSDSASDQFSILDSQFSKNRRRRFFSGGVSLDVDAVAGSAVVKRWEGDFTRLKEIWERQVTVVTAATRPVESFSESAMAALPQERIVAAARTIRDQYVRRNQDQSIRMEEGDFLDLFPGLERELDREEVRAFFDLTQQLSQEKVLDFHFMSGGYNPGRKVVFLKYIPGMFSPGSQPGGASSAMTAAEAIHILDLAISPDFGLTEAQQALENVLRGLLSDTHVEAFSDMSVTGRAGSELSLLRHEAGYVFKMFRSKFGRRFSGFTPRTFVKAMAGIGDQAVGCRVSLSEREVLELLLTLLTRKDIEGYRDDHGGKPSPVDRVFDLLYAKYGTSIGSKASIAAQLKTLIDPDNQIADDGWLELEMTTALQRHRSDMESKLWKKHQRRGETVHSTYYDPMSNKDMTVMALARRWAGDVAGDGLSRNEARRLILRTVDGLQNTRIAGIKPGRKVLYRILWGSPAESSSGLVRTNGGIAMDVEYLSAPAASSGVTVPVRTDIAGMTFTLAARSVSTVGEFIGM